MTFHFLLDDYRADHDPAGAEDARRFAKGLVSGLISVAPIWAGVAALAWWLS